MKKWLSQVSYQSSAVRLDLSVMATAYLVFGLSLLFQPHRWQSTPAYHVLLQIFAAQAWGGLFLVSGTLLAVAAWWFERSRWVAVGALTLAVALTIGWMLAFVVRYLSNPATTPETWVSWAVFGFLLLRAVGGIDRPRGDVRQVPEVTAFKRAISDALDAADDDRKAIVAAALDTEGGRLRAAVEGACAAYADALRSVVPAGAMPVGLDRAGQAIAEARNALLRAEEAYERATGNVPGPPDAP